jgi:hypothetical protein
MTLKCSYFSSRANYFALVIAAMVVFIGFTGCSIKYSFKGATTVGLKTISVQYFQNRASLVQPALSQYITDELIKKFKSQTNLSFVTNAGDADFEGQITDYNTIPLTVAGDARAAMNRFTITVEVTFTNIVDPTLSYKQVFSRYMDYDSSMDLSQVEKQLSDKIVEMLVEDIFNKAFVNW